MVDHRLPSVFSLDQYLLFKPQEKLESLPNGILLGSGVFTTFRWLPAYGVFHLKEHFERLRHDCEFYGWSFPWPDFVSFEKSIVHLLDQYFKDRSTVVRITLSPYQTIFNDPSEDIPQAMAVWLTHRPYHVDKPGVDPLFLTAPISLKSATFERPFPHTKHVNYQWEQVYLERAKRQGFDDILRLSPQYVVQEASRSNVFFMTHDQRFLTPMVETGCLPGTMRGTVIGMLRDAGYSVEETVIYGQQLSHMTGAFLTNAVRGMAPIQKIDDIHYVVQDVRPILAQVNDRLLQSMVVKV